MIFTALARECRDYREMAERELELGLDARVAIADLPVRFGGGVVVRDRVELQEGGAPALIHRSYETPSGTLTAAIRKTDDWPHGDRLPLFGDRISPRATKFLVTGPEDLEPLRYLLADPTAGDISQFQEEAVERAAFADARGLLLTAGWSTERRPAAEDPGLAGTDYGTATVVDALMWLCGATQPLLWAYDHPEFLTELIAILESYNRRRLEIHLDSGAEVVLHRGWYEGTEFWSPRLYRQFVLPVLRREADLCHQAGVYLAYILTSGMLPIAEAILESGVDVVVGIDPGEGKGTTLEAVRQELGGKIGLWGGVSGPLAIEQGTEHEVRAAVEGAMGVLAPAGGFILSPVDNVTESTARAWRNVQVFIETWRALS